LDIKAKFAFLFCAIVILAIVATNLSDSKAGLVGLSLADLLHQSDVIILGNVTDKKLSFHGLLNHTISIDKIINGTYSGNTINVFGQVPEVVEDAVDLKKGERVILFLYKEKNYDGQYAVVGTQGKYDVDSNGRVHGYNLPRIMSVATLEKCMVDKVCSSYGNGNDTRGSYTNDTDLITNESN
jgi:hypothetical protein